MKKECERCHKFYNQLYQTKEQFEGFKANRLFCSKCTLKMNHYRPLGRLGHIKWE